MKSRSLPFFVLALLAAPLCAQRLAESVNEGPPFTKGSTSAVNVIAIRHSVKRAMILTAVEFWCGATSGTGSVYVFDHDSKNNRPGALLAQGTFPAPPARCWAGAVLNKPVVVKKAGQVIWVGISLSKGGGISATGRNPNGATYFWTRSVSTPIQWHGPYKGWNWMFRLYEAGGKGAFSTYGKGKQGTHGVPGLEARGWPNYGNPITLIASLLKNQSTGLLVWGRKARIPFPFGTVYAFPPLKIDPFATAGGKTNPESRIFPLKIPKDPALVGLHISWQVWILDPGAKDGLAHTAGLEATIG